MESSRQVSIVSAHFPQTFKKSVIVNNRTFRTTLTLMTAMSDTRRMIIIIIIIITIRIITIIIIIIIIIFIIIVTIIVGIQIVWYQKYNSR